MFLPFDENFVKVDTVDSETIGLKEAMKNRDVIEEEYFQALVKKDWYHLGREAPTLTREVSN